MAKKQSLFDDRPKEIQELTYLIKQDLNTLHTEISKLQEVAEQICVQNCVYFIAI